MSSVCFGVRFAQSLSFIRCIKRTAFILILLPALISLASAQVLFEDKTSTAGPFHTGESWGSSWGNLNNDLYPDLFVSNHGMTSSIYRNNGDGTFTDVIVSADLDQKLVKAGDIDTNLADIHGGTWADFDNDGDQDLFVARSSQDGQIFLFENDGNGNLSQNHSDYGIPIDDTLAGRMAILFDYNGDGLLDFTYAANGSGMPLFKRQGNNFVYAQNEAGIVNQCSRNIYGLASRLFDSGNLIYVCLDPSEIAQRAYDTSTIPFTDVTSSIDRIGTWSDAVLADVDNNGALDLIATTGKSRPNGVKRISSQRIESWVSVTSGQEKKITFKSDAEITVNLYSRKVASKNQSNGDQYDRILIGSNGSFPASLPITLNPSNPNHQGVRANRNPLGAYMGYDPAAQEWTIYLSAANNSDLVYFTFNGTGLTTPSMTGLTGVDGPRTPKILLNNGTKLEDTPGARGLESVMCGAVAAEDFDNDMDVDLYLVCRTSLENLANRFYWNDGDGTFTPGDVHGAEGIVGMGVESRTGTGDMATTADYDADGFMDIFLTNGNRIFPHFRKDGFTGGGPDQLFRNQGNSNHWLEIDLQGVNSNRDAFGAKVSVTAGGVTQLREQNGKYHRVSHDHQRLHFGLGSNASATVTIDWPDGTVDVHNNVTADKLYLAIQNGTIQAQNPSGQGVSISIAGQTVTEGGSAQMTISLSKPATQNVVVNYATANGTATQGLDYTGRSGIIVFSPGQTLKTRTVTTLQDTLVEGTEQFTMRLSNAVNATLAQSTATATITDDDVATGVVVSIADQTVSEGGNAALVISLSQPATNNVVVNYATANASATQPQDYTARSGVVVFNPGQTQKTRTVTTIQDNLNEGNEQFTMILTNPVNASLGQSTGTVTINDDDGPAGVMVNITGQNVIEGGAAVMTISLSQSAAQNVVVDYATANAGARDGLDYTGRTGVIVFSPGETLKTRTVQTLQDNLVETAEQFRMNLSNPRNASLGQSTATVTINDDDGIAANAACGEPDYDRTTERGMFLWRDCNGDNRWYIRVTSGGGSQILDYSGEITTNRQFTSVQEFGFESTDVLNVSNQLLSFSMEVTNIWEDGFSFRVNPGNSCITLNTPAGTTIVVGEDQTPVSSSFDLDTLAACGSAPGIVTQGEPAINATVDNGLFMWKISNDWHLKAVSGSGVATISGAIDSLSNFTNVMPISIESSDVFDFTSNPQLINFELLVTPPWEDTFKFTSSAQACVSSSAPAGTQLFIGPNRVAVQMPFDLSSLTSTACQ